MRKIEKDAEAKLNRLLSYDEGTGVFTWRKDVSRGAKKGCVAGSLTKCGYIEIGVLGQRILAHRLAWYLVKREWPTQSLDHKNGIRSDNRIENLREASPSVNSQNLAAARVDSSTGLLGVFPNKKRFSAQICLNGKRHHLGTFDTPEEAHQTYLRAKKSIHPGSLRLGQPAGPRIIARTQEAWGVIA